MRVRPCRSSDLDGVAALLGLLDQLHARLQPGFFRAAKGGPAGPDPALRKLPGQPLGQLLNRRDAAVLVVEEASALLGAACVRLYDTPPALALAARRRAHLESLVVAPAARRRGVGRRLMEAAEAWSRSRGAEQLLLTVWADNEAAEHFYRRLGYAPASQVLVREL